MAKPIFPDIKADYGKKWDDMEVPTRVQPRVDATAAAIVASQAIYETVSSATGVPWYVVGLIHSMEASLNFRRHLHNGDPLAERTVHVPAGRPKLGAPPFTWEESAVDALEHDGLGAIHAWTVERIAYVMEGFNGWGYRRASVNIPTPYLWSFTNHYKKGKYVADGRYDPNAVSKQIGAMPLLAAVAKTSGVVLTREGEAGSAI